MRLFILFLVAFLWSENSLLADGEKDQGKFAAEFELQDLDGKVHRLANYLESGSVVLWFTNLCGGCQRGLAELKEVFADFQVTLLIVSLLADDMETPEQVRKKYELNFPILLDPEGIVCRKYSGINIPQTCPLENFFLIDTKGTIEFRGHYPGLEKSELKNLIQLKVNK